MSDRGSILISTANDIGEALVEKLGGVGYSPNEWKEKYNLCGIAPIDSAPALSVLSDSAAGTGDERGSILIATADAIGAILNKKYNVLRGFKPKEWASACRKMKALEEGSVASASIASFSDGADTVPLTSCVCTIDANLDGKTAVVCTKTGKNLLNYADISQSYRVTSITENSIGSFTVVASGLGAYIDHVIKVKAGQTYAIKCASATNDEGNATQIGAVNVYDGDNSSATLLLDGASINYSAKTFTPTGNYILVRNKITGGLGAGTGTIVEPQLEVGSTATTYEPYQTPETKTADLGRVVYGGTADIITGEGTDEYEILTLAVADMNNSENYPGWRNCGVREIIGAEVSSSVTDGVSTVGQYWSYNTLGSNDILYLPRGQYNNMTQTDWINTYPDLIIKFAIKKATPENFTFEPVKIDSFPGVNNIWSDCGNTAVEYYQAPTPYTRKTATGGIANFSDQRTDLPLTKAIANIAPSIAGKSAVNLVRTGASLANIADVSGSMTNQYFYNIGSDYVLTAGTTYKIAMEVNSTVTPFAVSVGVGDDAYRYDIYNTGINNKNGVVAFEFTVEASHLATWNKLWIRAPRYSAPGEPSTPTTCTFTVKNITLYSTATTYTAELGETVYGGSVDFVSGEVKKAYGKYTVTGQETGDFLAGTNNNGNRIGIRIPGAQTPLYTGGVSNIGENKACLASSTWTIGSWCIYTDNKLYFVVPNEYTNFSTALQYLVDNNATFVFPLATPTESTIPGRVISPIEGVNNYWNDAGGDTEIQYFEDEA